MCPFPHCSLLVVTQVRLFPLSTSTLRGNSTDFQTKVQSSANLIPLILPETSCCFPPSFPGRTVIRLRNWGQTTREIDDWTQTDAQYNRNISRTWQNKQTKTKNNKCSRNENTAEKENCIVEGLGFSIEVTITKTACILITSKRPKTKSPLSLIKGALPYIYRVS